MLKLQPSKMNQHQLASQPDKHYYSHVFPKKVQVLMKMSKITEYQQQTPEQA